MELRQTSPSVPIVSPYPNGSWCHGARAVIAVIVVAIALVASVPTTTAVAQEQPAASVVELLNNNSSSSETENQPDSADEDAEPLDTRDRIDSVNDKLQAMLDDFVLHLPLLGVAIVVVVIFWFLAKLISASELLFRWIDNRFSRDLFRQFIRGLIVGIGVLIALELLNATSLVGATLGAAGVAGIAVAFAFKDLAENYIAGVLLSTRQPFAPNDLVVINSDEGKVVRLTSRATILMTLEGNHLRIPNSVVYKGIITNYSRNPLRRFDVTIGVGVNEDLVHAQQLGLSILGDMRSVLEDPAPWCIIEELGDSNVSVRFYGWVDQKASDFSRTKSEATRLLKTAFDDAGVEMPEPTYRVALSTDSAGAQLVEASAQSHAQKPRRDRALNATEQDTSAGDDIDSQIAAERQHADDDLLEESGRPE